MCTGKVYVCNNIFTVVSCQLCRSCSEYKNTDNIIVRSYVTCNGLNNSQKLIGLPIIDKATSTFKSRLYVIYVVLFGLVHSLHADN